MKIRWSILALQLMFVVNGLFLIVAGLLTIQNYFTRARMYVAFGVILLNVAVILSFLHKSQETTETRIQPTFASLQVLCPLCNKPNVSKADYCSICGHKLDVETAAN